MRNECYIQCVMEIESMILDNLKTTLMIKKVITNIFRNIKTHSMIHGVS